MKSKTLSKVNYSTTWSITIYFTLIMTMFITVSCENDIETTGLNEQQIVRKPSVISENEVLQYAPKVVDNRLVFKDSVSFDNYQQWVLQNQCNPEKIYNLNRSLGFISMKEIFEEGLSSLENCNNVTNDFIQANKNVFHATEIAGSIIQDLQAPSVLAYIANKDGIYQIDKKIIRISYDYYYVITDGDETLIPLIVNAEGSEISNKNVYVQESRSMSKSEYSYRTNYFSDNKRVVARLQRRNSDGNVYFDAVTNSQKKVLGIWLGVKLDGVWVSWPNGYYVFNGTNYPINGATHGSENNQTIDETFCILTQGQWESTLLDLVASYLPTTHWGKDGSTQKTIVYTNSFLGYY